VGTFVVGIAVRRASLALLQGGGEVEARYNDVFDHLAPTYRAMANDGILSPEHAWRELTHETWEMVAPGLGLRYDRAAPIDDADDGDDAL
jgi:hypothetical protein